MPVVLLKPFIHNIIYLSLPMIALVLLTHQLWLGINYRTATHQRNNNQLPLPLPTCLLLHCIDLRQTPLDKLLQVKLITASTMRGN